MQSTISSVLSKAYDVEAFRQLGHELIDHLSDHLNAIQTKENPITIPYSDPEDELTFWLKDMEKGGEPIDFLDTILKRSIRVHHPGYIGHQVAVPAFISSLAGLVSDVLNNGSGVYEMGMPSNALERIITDLMAKKVGYENGGGMLTSGGSLANLTALLAARKAKAPTAVWELGHNEKLAIMVSKEAHYCIDKAARIMGIGEEGVITIPSDEQHKIRIDVLEEYLIDAKAKGFHVIAMVGCAASTATGSYDDLVQLAAFSQKHNLWFHVDGAHGGPVILSKKYAYLAEGIELADSVTIDFHKLMMTPALNTALLYREEADSYKTFQQEALYLYNVQQIPEWYQSSKKTFECTKLMLSIKFYILLRTYGMQVFEDYIDTVHDKARAFAAMINKHPDFELAIQPESNIINFRFIKCSETHRDTVNAQILRKLIDEGEFYIVQTILRGKRHLRVTVMNPLTTEDDFEKLLQKLSKFGHAVSS